MHFLAGEAGVIDINGTVVVELITFLIMLAILARYVYPEIVKLAEARQRAVAEQLREAEKARADAEAQLKDAQAKLEDARKTAQGVVDAAGKSAEQLRAEMKEKAEMEAKRISESARKEIEAERDRALQSVRGEVAGLVVAATEKVIGETLDVTRHKQLIDRAIEEVASGDGSRRQSGS
jgi:F-type H+-transporting ATPase subunit b